MKAQMNIHRKRPENSRLRMQPIGGPSILVAPPVVFCGVWGVTLGLISLQMTTQLVPMAPAALWMIAGNMAFAILMAITLGRLGSRPQQQIDAIDLGVLDKFARKLRLVWIVGTVIEIVASGGLPIQWAIMSDANERNYTDFGIPSIHGVMNALYLQMMSAYFLIWQLNGDKKKRNLFFLFLIWPILMLGRGIFLSAVIQSLGIFLLIYTIHFRAIFIVAIVALINIILFGLIGNLRGTSNQLEYLIEDQWRGVFDFLPSGFLWIYVYITSGLNNVFFNSDNLEPLWQFKNTFAKLIPSIVWIILGSERQSDIFEFADPRLNVSTMYAGAMSDFGIFGGFLFGCIIVTFSSLIFIYAKQHYIWAILFYCVVFQGLVFSIFYDMFFLLPTIMQFVVAAAFGLHYRRWRRKPPRQEAEAPRTQKDAKVD